ncbi:C-type lectin domain family 7 member A-like [Neocloeon triangulifer]|uniref:C-type lectin domain family 7 member A-like n=1 Tax=Neocloeon triangulifer TaxID=2078957 RepID=UPI00286EB901|nr:C-type lectin domain family 7 member A-like [Neocloeon triangulifer]
MQTKRVLLLGFVLLVVIQLCLADVDDDRQRNEIERARRRRKEKLRAERAERRLQKEQRLLQQLERGKRHREHRPRTETGNPQPYEAQPPVHNRHRLEQENLRAERNERRRVRQEQNEVRRNRGGRRRQHAKKLLRSNELDRDERRNETTRPNYVCPPDFVRLGNSCYLLSKQILAWQEAHHYCRDMGSHLASLETAWEDGNMRDYINRKELARLERWIGGRYNWETSKWIWGSSGKRMGYQGFSRRNSNDDRTWHCVFMDPTRQYRWAHKSCFQALHFICEAPLQKELPPKDNNEI